jgi:hypothetical protein
MSCIAAKTIHYLGGIAAAGETLSLASSLAKKQVFGEFRDQLFKLCAGLFCLLLAQGCQPEQNLGKWPQVVALIGGDLKLLDA